MGSPLLADTRAPGKARAWHKAVFDLWGRICWICKKPGTDAAHVVPRPQLGSQRYCSPLIGRVLCRRCHNEQHLGNKKYQFSKSTICAATKEANNYLKQPIICRACGKEH